MRDKWKLNWVPNERNPIKLKFEFKLLLGIVGMPSLFLLLKITVAQRFDMQDGGFRWYNLAVYCNNKKCLCNIPVVAYLIADGWLCCNQTVTITIQRETSNTGFQPTKKGDQGG